ncbi:MAG: RtcB family protein [Gammaproteobacteria bacterium]
MDITRLHRHSACEWEIPAQGTMRVPAILYASEPLMLDMDDKVYEQLVNVAALPGIVSAAYAMPDAHWGYGFPIGGVAAFEPLAGGVVSAGGVGFDISCGVRTLTTDLVRADVEAIKQRLADLLPQADLRLLYDVSHNTSKEATHPVDDVPRRLFVHRKGATRALGPGHPDLPEAEAFQAQGQPVLIGGSMGTASYVLAGLTRSTTQAFASACHGAGRAMSRHAASRRWSGQQVVDELAARGILVRSISQRGIAEEAPGAYKDVGAGVDAAEQAGLARKVARLEPLICIKG